MGKKKRARRRHVADAGAEIDPGLLAAFLSDPIALWQDGEYEALEALYAKPDRTDATPNSESKDPEAGALDELPF